MGAVSGLICAPRAADGCGWVRTTDRDRPARFTIVQCRDVRGVGAPTNECVATQYIASLRIRPRSSASVVSQRSPVAIQWFLEYNLRDRDTLRCYSALH